MAESVDVIINVSYRFEKLQNLLNDIGKMNDFNLLCRYDYLLVNIIINNMNINKTINNILNQIIK